MPTFQCASPPLKRAAEFSVDKALTPKVWKDCADVKEMGSFLGQTRRGTAWTLGVLVSVFAQANGDRPCVPPTTEQVLTILKAEEESPRPISQIKQDKYDDFMQVVREGTTTEYVRTSRGKKAQLRDNVPPDFLNLPMPPARVLDIGAGQTATLVQELRAQGIEAFGLDLRLDPSVLSLPYLREGDMLQLPYENASFDVVISFHSVLAPQYEGENLVLVTQALREMQRVVRPGGVIRLWPAGEREIRAVVSTTDGLQVLRVLDPDDNRSNAKAIELIRTR
jgi:SAM-dependent methyltransferase